MKHHVATPLDTSNLFCIYVPIKRLFPYFNKHIVDIITMLWIRSCPSYIPTTISAFSYQAFKRAHTWKIINCGIDKPSCKSDFNFCNHPLCLRSSFSVQEAETMRLFFFGIFLSHPLSTLRVIISIANALLAIFNAIKAFNCQIRKYFP